MAGPEAKLRRNETLNGCEVREDLIVCGDKVISIERECMHLVKSAFECVPVAQKMNTPIHYIVRLFCTGSREKAQCVFEFLRVYFNFTDNYGSVHCTLAASRT
jgi:hypothetical protein